MQQRRWLGCSAEERYRATEDARSKHRTAGRTYKGVRDKGVSALIVRQSGRVASDNSCASSASAYPLAIG